MELWAAYGRATSYYKSVQNPSADFVGLGGQENMHEEIGI